MVVTVTAVSLAFESCGVASDRVYGSYHDNDMPGPKFLGLVVDHFLDAGGVPAAGSGVKKTREIPAPSRPLGAIYVCAITGLGTV